MNITKSGVHLGRSLLAAVLFLVPLGVYLLVTLVPKLHVAEPVSHLFLTLTAVMGVHLLDRLVLFRETYDNLKLITEGIQASVEAQTKSLASTSASLQAMIAAGIGRLYSGREAAADDIRRDITDPSNKTLRLIGISLNDFIRADERTLAETWADIRRFIDEDRALDIKLLIIDPACYGAQMRSRGESRAQASMAGRLSEDVLAVAESLRRLEARMKDKQHTKFECRFYRIAPTLFLCQVDSASYVQQYYFWAQRNSSRSSPVIRFRQTEGVADGCPMHEGMRDHFKWIWDHASIPISDVLDGKAIGSDKGLRQSGIANVFASRGEGRNRIKWLLENAKQTVWIQGVSLRSFLEPGELFNSLVTLVKRGDVDLRILVIDKRCEQAKYRSYRERLFADPDLKFETYLNSGQHDASDLFRDTDRSITNLRVQMAALRKKMPGLRPRLQVREYSTTPGCFMLRVDDTVLVEQYHYGKVVPEDQRDAPAILGKDMPLVEYQRDGPTLYDATEEFRNPVILLNDHFQFAFDRAKELDIQGGDGEGAA